jgi:hypothetical protein
MLYTSGVTVIHLLTPHPIESRNHDQSRRRCGPSASIGHRSAARYAYRVNRLLLLAFLLAGCAAPQSGSVEHAVFVWLKRPNNAHDRAALVEATKDLQKSTGLIRTVRHGTAVPSDRPVVDDTFDLALLMRFDDRRDLAAFETHPAHLQAKKEILQPLARKIRIHDIAWD